MSTKTFWSKMSEPNGWSKFRSLYCYRSDVWAYVKHISRGYGRCIAKKGLLLLQLTFGVWTEDLFDAMEIDALAKRFNDVETLPRHQEVMKHVGLSHSLFWQFLPGCVIIAKLGEACSNAPWCVLAPQARLKDDVQDRIELTFLFIIEFLLTVTFALRPKVYVLWFSFCAISLRGLKEVSIELRVRSVAAAFDSFFHQLIMMPVSVALGLPTRPTIVSVEQVGFSALVRFKIPEWRWLGSRWSESNRFTNGFDILTHTDGMECGVPRMHVGDSATARATAYLRQTNENTREAARQAPTCAPSCAEVEKAWELSVLLPIRSTNNIETHDDRLRRIEMQKNESGTDRPGISYRPPTLYLPPQTDFKKLCFPNFFFSRLPGFPTPGSQVSFRVAACNVIGRGAFSSSFPLHLRVPFEQEFAHGDETVNKLLEDSRKEEQRKDARPVYCHGFFKRKELEAWHSRSPHTCAIARCRSSSYTVPVAVIGDDNDGNDDRDSEELSVFNDEKRLVFNATPQLEDEWAAGHVPLQDSSDNELDQSDGERGSDSSTPLLIAQTKAKQYPKRPVRALVFRSVVYASAVIALFATATKWLEGWRTETLSPPPSSAPSTVPSTPPSPVPSPAQSPEPSLTPSVTSVPTSVPPGLLAHYSFQSGSLTSDSSGLGNDCVAIGGGVYSVPDRWGTPDQAVRFDGSGYLSCHLHGTVANATVFNGSRTICV